MENTYLGILRGKLLPIEISAGMLLKGAEDKVLFLETKQISGYTTRLTLLNALKTAIEQEPESLQLQLLFDELKSMNISDDLSRAASDVEKGQQLLEWIGI